MYGTSLFPNIGYQQLCLPTMPPATQQKARTNRLLCGYVRARKAAKMRQEHQHTRSRQLRTLYRSMTILSSDFSSFSSVSFSSTSGSQSSSHASLSDEASLSDDPDDMPSLKDISEDDDEDSDWDEDLNTDSDASFDTEADDEMSVDDEGDFDGFSTTADCWQ